MADLNKTLDSVQRKSSEIKKMLKNFMVEYENLYREGNRQLIAERTASGSMEGLEQFHRLIQIIRRNRDVAGSLVRGITNLRPMSEFKFVEEDIPKKSLVKSKRSKKQVVSKAPSPPPEFNPEQLEHKVAEDVDA